MARSQGGDPSKAKRAEDAEKQCGAWIKQVGATDQAVANKLKTCRGRLEKSEKAILRVRSAIEKAEQEIVAVKARIDDLRVQARAHQGRRDALADQVRHLSSQVYAAAVPSREEELRRALERMQQIADPALQAALDLLAPMVTPAAGTLATFHIATGDTSSDDDGDDGISIDDGAATPTLRPLHGGAAADSAAAEAAAELDDARTELQRLHHARDMELQQARAATRHKRGLDDDAPEQRDDDGDCEMVAVLTKAQVEEKYAEQIGQVSLRLQGLVSRLHGCTELSLATPAPGAPANL